MGIAACHDWILCAYQISLREVIGSSKLAMKLGGQRPRQHIVDVNSFTVLSRTEDASDGASQFSSHNMLASA